MFFNEFSKVSNNEVLEDLSNAIFDLQKNQISNVIETPLAKHLVIVKNIYPQNQKTLDQSKEEITNNLQKVELDNYILDLKNNISQQILDGLSLNEIATDNLLSIETIKHAERQINQNENDLVKNEEQSESFLQEQVEFCNSNYDWDIRSLELINKLIDYI